MEENKEIGESKKEIKEDIRHIPGLYMATLIKSIDGIDDQFVPLYQEGECPYGIEEYLPDDFDPDFEPGKYSEGDIHYIKELIKESFTLEEIYKLTAYFSCNESVRNIIIKPLKIDFNFPGTPTKYLPEEEWRHSFCSNNIIPFWEDEEYDMPFKTYGLHLMDYMYAGTVLRETLTLVSEFGEKEFRYDAIDAFKETLDELEKYMDEHRRHRDQQYKEDMIQFFK